MIAVPPRNLPTTEKAKQRYLRRFARQHFDAEALRWYCTADDFTDLGQLYEVGSRKFNDFYIFRDNGAKTLAVAHLDTVCSKRKFWMTNTPNGPVIRSPALDDRLGAYVIADLLPKLGVESDILLTTGEESGMSTAEYFKASHDYNWIYSFDRAGTDVVMYDYETAELRGLLRQVGAPVGIGSFSDIAFLEHLSVSGFNWGVGYQDYHSYRAFAPLRDTMLSVGRFLSFYGQHSERAFEFDPKTKEDRWASYWGSYAQWDTPKERERWAKMGWYWDDSFNGYRWAGSQKELPPIETCPVCEEPLTHISFCDHCDWNELDHPVPKDKGKYDLTDAEWRAEQERAFEEAEAS